MKKILMTLAAITLLMAMPVLTSCSVEDIPATNPVQEELAEATIIWYGTGGGNVDPYILADFRQFYDARPESFDRVNIVAQYKASLNPLVYQGLTDEEVSQKAKELAAGKTEKELEAMTMEDYFFLFHPKRSATYRFAVDPAKTLRQQFLETEPYGAMNCDFTCPDSLTNFINWAAQKYPAKKYMLIVADHGGGYIPVTDLPETVTTRTNRGLLVDDGNNRKTISVWALTRGIRNANVRLQTVFMLACMMNNMEYQFELKDLCDYVIASTYTMPSWGVALYELPELLSQPNVDIEKALDTYCKDDVKSWDTEDGKSESTVFYSDMTVTRTANIDKLGTMMRQFVDRLCETYTNGTEAQKQAIDSCTARAVKVQENYPYYDVAKYMSSIMSALPEVYDVSFYNQMEDAFNSCIVAQYYSAYLTAHHYMVDYSVLLGAGGAHNYIMWNKNQETGAMTPTSGLLFTDNGEKYQFALVPTDDSQSYKMENITLLDNWGGTLASAYEPLAFDKAVGWSRWLRLNGQWPNIFCPSGLEFELPSPDTGFQD